MHGCRLKDLVLLLWDRRIREIYSLLVIWLSVVRMLEASGTLEVVDVPAKLRVLCSKGSEEAFEV